MILKINSTPHAPAHTLQTNLLYFKIYFFLILTLLTVVANDDGDMAAVAVVAAAAVWCTNKMETNIINAIICLAVVAVRLGEHIYVSRCINTY